MKFHTEIRSILKDLKRIYNFFGNNIFGFILIFNSYLYFFLGIWYLFSCLRNGEVLAMEKIIPYFELKVVDGALEQISNNYNIIFFALLFAVLPQVKTRLQKIKLIGSVSFLLFYVISLIFYISGSSDYIYKVSSSPNVLFSIVASFIVGVGIHIFPYVIFILIATLIFDKNKFHTFLGLMISLIIVFFLFVGEILVFDFIYKLLYYIFPVFLPYIHIRFLYKEYEISNTNTQYSKSLKKSRV